MTARSLNRVTILPFAKNVKKHQQSVRGVLTYLAMAGARAQSLETHLKAQRRHARNGTTIARVDDYVS